MSRVDVPTLRCDRCGLTTKDLREMATFQELTHYSQSATEKWDLCPACWQRFRQMIYLEASDGV